MALESSFTTKYCADSEYLMPWSQTEVHSSPISSQPGATLYTSNTGKPPRLIQKGMVKQKPPTNWCSTLSKKTSKELGKNGHNCCPRLYGPSGL